MLTFDVNRSSCPKSWSSRNSRKACEALVVLEVQEDSELDRL